MPLHVGQYVRPKPDSRFAIYNGGSLWGWKQSVAKVVQVHPHVEVLMLPGALPSGWRKGPFELIRVAVTSSEPVCVQLEVV